MCFISVICVRGLVHLRTTVPFHVHVFDNAITAGQLGVLTNSSQEMAVQLQYTDY